MVAGRRVAGMDVELVGIDWLCGDRGAVGHAVRCRRAGHVDVDERRARPGRVAADAPVVAAGNGLPENTSRSGQTVIREQILPPAPFSRVLICFFLQISIDTYRPFLLDSTNHFHMPFHGDKVRKST